MSILDRELALFAKFKDAPKELQELSELHNKNFQRLDKAKSQILLWQQEMINAEKDYMDSGKKFRTALAQWAPKTSEEQKLEEKVK